MIRKDYRFVGDVQGVNFRGVTYQKATNLGLVGWVKNLHDGSVEMQIQGTEEQIDELIRFLKKNMFVQDEDITCKSMEINDDTEFHIV